MPHPSRNWGTKWADCERCGQTTDPDADVLGVPNPGDTVVKHTDDGMVLLHRACAGEGRTKRLADYM